MRHAIAIGLLLLAGVGVAAQNPAQPAGAKEQPSLQQKIQAADLVVVGKVTETKPTPAGSVDIATLEIKEVLKGAKTKTTQFKFTSSGGIGIIPSYAKVGVEGVWILKKTAAGSDLHNVLAYLPVGELKAVRDILADLNKKQGPPPQAGKTLKVYAQALWNRAAPGDQLVLRSAAELTKAFPPLGVGPDAPEAEKLAVKQAAQALKVADTDWKTQMVVVLHYGKPSTGGHSVSITGLVVTDGTLVIDGTRLLPGAKMPNVEGYLTLIALVDRFDGPVQFKIKTNHLP
jgi:hypothetical protein